MSWKDTREQKIVTLVTACWHIPLSMQQHSVSVARGLETPPSLSKFYNAKFSVCWTAI